MCVRARTCVCVCVCVYIYTEILISFYVTVNYLFGHYEAISQHTYLLPLLSTSPPQISNIHFYCQISNKKKSQYKKIEVII